MGLVVLSYPEISRGLLGREKGHKQWTRSPQLDTCRTGPCPDSMRSYDVQIPRRVLARHLPTSWSLPRREAMHRDETWEEGVETTGNIFLDISG